MRLSVLDTGHRPRAKAFLALTSLMSRADSPDIVKMLLYRPEFLTRPLLDLTVPAMRGPSYWTAGEREFLAMRSARKHRSEFCALTHAELTRIAGNGEIDPDDPATARAELLAVSDFLDAPSPDRRAAVAVTDEVLAEALRVRLVWNIVNRLANAFGFELREGQLRSGTRALHRVGYRFPGFLLGGGDTTLRQSVLEGPALTDRALRQAAATGDGLAEPWASYTAMVRDESHRVTDADVTALVRAGHTEDEVFELTVAAAVGAALTEYDSAS